MIGYWHRDVVCPSVTLYIVALKRVISCTIVFLASNILLTSSNTFAV